MRTQGQILGTQTSKDGLVRSNFYSSEDFFPRPTSVIIMGPQESARI